MKILMTGGNGMLAQDVRQIFSTKDNVELVSLPSSALDITQARQISEKLEHHEPDVLLNCAAYTQVDQAETEPERAFEVNGIGPGLLADACRRLGVRLVHISTDFVFDGEATESYTESAQPNPLSVYGKSKRQGEVQIEAVGGDWLVVRTSWVLAAHGRNFLRTMLRLAESHRELRVVSDQVGTPTWTRDLAEALWELIQAEASGYCHFASSNQCSWYELSNFILKHALAKQMNPNKPCIQPIISEEYPLPATRPKFSALSTAHYQQLTGQTPPRWQHAVEQILANLSQQSDQ